MRKIKIVSIVGARPNFVKIASLLRQMKKVSRFRLILIHTGQHSSREMSKNFFKDLEIPFPDIYLRVENSFCSKQTAKIMINLEKVITKIKPDLSLVVGDVDSTLAGALVSSRLGIPLVHVEAGLRSFDRSMPEEVNRVIVDSLSEYLFTTCSDADMNLRKEGIHKRKIFFVGNPMIDTLIFFRKKAMAINTIRRFSLEPKGFSLATLHRPSNVDCKERLEKIFGILKDIGTLIKVIFPVYPRTRKKIDLFEIEKHIRGSNVILTKPLGYLEYLNLMLNAKFVLTDSGGVQEEASAIGLPCLTLRDNTERPITVLRGTNTVVGKDRDLVLRKIREIMSGRYKKGKTIKFWDGKAAQRIVKILESKLQ